MKKNYGELLKDPQWQRKRLEVFHKADFKCEQCSSADKTLHAHHKRYISGRKPWEYELDDFECLCEECHDRVSVAQRLLSGKCESKELQDSVNSFIHSLSYVLAELGGSEEEAKLIFDYLGDTVHDLDLPSRQTYGLHEYPLSAMFKFMSKAHVEFHRGLRNAVASVEATN